MKKSLLAAALLWIVMGLCAVIPENHNFSDWKNGENLPQKWSFLNRQDRQNTVQKINGGIKLNGMILSDRFTLPSESKDVKITLKTKSVKKFLKVYLFQYFDKKTPYFQQCGQAYDLKESKGNTYVTSLNISMQGQRYAAFALDGEGAEIESVSLEPIVKAKVEKIPCEIPVIFHTKAPRMDGKYHPEDWKNSFTFKNPFRSLAQKVNFFDGETISLMSDGNAFFIQLRTPNARNAKYTTHDSNVFLDSGLELVFQAVDQPRMLHVVVNFAGAVYDEEMAVGQKFKNWNCAGVKTSVCKDGKDTLLSIAIPFASLKINPNDGWKFNICRNRPEVSEYSAMNQGGYFNELMNATLIKDLKSCYVGLKSEGRLFTFEAKADGSSMNVSEYGGNSFLATLPDVSKGASAKAKRPEIADGIFQISLSRNGKKFFRTDAQFGKMGVKAAAKETHTQLIYYPIQKKVAVVFHGLSFSQRDNLGKVICRIGNQNIVLDKFFSAGGVTITEKPFAIPADGTYKWNLSVIQKDGKLMEKNSGEFSAKTKYEWIGNDLGKDRIVIPPFTKMTVKGNVVGCTLRDTKFGANGFPESIVAAGKEVLNSPIKLYCTDSNGKEHEFRGNGFKFTSKADDRVEMTGGASAENLKAELSAWMEYDGVIFYTMDLKAVKPVEVQKVYLEIPCEQADFFHIVGPSFRSTKLFWNTKEFKSEGIVWKSSQNPIGKNVFGTFLPSLWLGSFRNGISFFAESDKNWINSRKSACYELIRRNGKFVLRVNFVSKSATLKGNRKIEFGLVATPLKKRPTGADLKFNWTTSFARTIFNKGMMVIDPFITRMMMDPKRKNSYVIYTAGQEYVEGDPEFKAFATEVDQEYKPGYNPWEVRSLLRRNGGMEYADYTSRVVVWNSYRVDFMLWRLNQLLKETDVDGIYEDNSYSSFSNNLLLKDHAFIREDGRVQGRYQFLKQREYLKRAAVLAHKYNKRYPRVVLHNTGAMMPAAFAFADGFQDGEMDITKYYNIFPMAWNEIMLGVDWGLVPGRLTMLRNAQKNQNRALFSVFKLYDMRFWITHEGFDQKHYRQIRNKEIEFGVAADGTEFFGYWQENNPVKVSGKSPLLASCYKRKDGALLIYVSNPTEKSASGILTFHKKMTVTNALNGKSVKFPFTLPMQDFTALLAVPEK